jgi:hypothetical protein
MLAASGYGTKKEIDEWPLLSLGVRFCSVVQPCTPRGSHRSATRSASRSNSGPFEGAESCHFSEPVTCPQCPRVGGKQARGVVRDKLVAAVAVAGAKVSLQIRSQGFDRESATSSSGLRENLSSSHSPQAPIRWLWREGFKRYEKPGPQLSG